MSLINSSQNHKSLVVLVPCNYLGLFTTILVYNQWNTDWPNHNLDEFHHLDIFHLNYNWVYQAAVSIQQLPAIGNPKILVPLVASSQTIGTNPWTNILKVLFESVSTIPNIMPLNFQILERGQHWTRPNYPFLQSTNNISVDTQITCTFDKKGQHDIIAGAHFLDKFDFTINYNKIILKWVDHEIPLKDPIKFFDTNMLSDFNL